MSAETEKRIHGYMAEFSTVPTLLAACRRIRDAGYTKTDAYAPFPIHGIDEALGIKPTALPWISLAGGLTGTITAFAMEIWMNGINYQYIISGKPFISLPAFVPVGFELTILLASFGAFFGMLALNRLPRFSNPVFTNPRFDAATDDKFFLYIDSADPRYNEEGVKRLLGDLSAESIEPVIEDDSSDKLPRPFIAIAATLAMLSIIPLLVAASMRVTTSGSPRFHVFYDMDFSPAKHTQKLTTIFADGRTMRPDVPGTVSRQQAGHDADFYFGIDMEKLAQLDPQRAERLVRFAGQPPADEPPVQDPPAQEPPAQEPPAQEPPAQEPPAQEPPATDPPAEEPKPTEPPAEEPKPTEPPAEEPKPTEPPAEEPKPTEPPAEEPMPTEPEAEPSAPSEPQQPAAEQPAPEAEPAAPVAEPAAPAADQAAPVVDDTPWLKTNPLELTEAVMGRGQQQFNIYCAVCHGRDGGGNGLVNQRAQKILAPNWVPPTSLHDDPIQQNVYPDGKLFSTISNGIRKMPGYSAQIKPEDRWAIVAYVRALQLSRNASESDVPAEMRGQLAAE